MHHVLIQKDHTHAHVKKVSPVMVAHVLISMNVAPILVEAMKPVKTRLDLTNAKLVVVEWNQMALNVLISTNAPRVLTVVAGWVTLI